LRLDRGGVALDLGTALSRVRAAPRAAPLARPSVPPRGVGPVLARLDAEALQSAIDPVVGRIIGHAKQFLAAVPEELRADVRGGGVCLAGGGALLHGLAERLAGALNARVARARDPLHAVVDGAHRIAAGDVRVPEWS
jgi:hypothetical protein